MLQIIGLHLFFPVEQQQPAIQVVSQHRQLEMHAVGRPPRGRVHRQSRVVVGFFDQILSPGALVIKPHQQVDGFFPVGHKNAIDVLRAGK